MDEEEFGGRGERRSRAAEGLLDAAGGRAHGKEVSLISASSGLDLDAGSLQRAGVAANKQFQVHQRLRRRVEDERNEEDLIAVDPRGKALVHQPGRKTAGKSVTRDDMSGSSYAVSAVQRRMITQDEEAALSKLATFGVDDNEDDGATSELSEIPEPRHTEQETADVAVAEHLKAMERLAKQNEELRKLAEVQRRELDRKAAEEDRVREGGERRERAELKEKGMDAYLTQLEAKRAEDEEREGEQAAQSGAAESEAQERAEEEEFRSYLASVNHLPSS